MWLLLLIFSLEVAYIRRLLLCQETFMPYPTVCCGFHLVLGSRIELGVGEADESSWQR
jgi:hypothetical protein